MIPDAGRDAGAGRDTEASRSGSRARAAAHRLPVRVYYEDTDLAGVVYHANYLRFAERGRSEWLRAMGIDQGRLRGERGLAFAVASMDARWLAPARFDDLLDVETTPLAVSGARAALRQAVARGGATLFEARVTIVATGPSGRATRLPPGLVAALRAALDADP